MAMETLTLIANPGSASRKYGLYRGDQLTGELHFEYKEGIIACTGSFGDQHEPIPVSIHDLSDVAGQVLPLLKAHNLIHADETISRIGLRIVAPSSYFLQDRVMDDETVGRLRELESRAPLHIGASLREFDTLKDIFAEAAIVGVSDSAFHADKPDYAWNYGVRLQDADRFDIKRFGYHGISVASIVHTLKEADKLPPKIIVAHLGSGASISAVNGGKSLDNTMGYSPLEGLIMSTRVGSIDPTAANMLQTQLHLNDEQMEDYLNSHSGLLGLSEVSSAVNELLEHEAHGNHNAELALQTYFFVIQKAIGSMAAALGGADMLVFTGTIAERSAEARRRIVDRLHYMDFILDEATNDTCDDPRGPTLVSTLAKSKPIYVIPTKETDEMLRRVTIVLDSQS
jgi:acetate kinase